MQKRQLEQQVMELWPVPTFTPKVPTPHVCPDLSFPKGFHYTPGQQTDKGVSNSTAEMEADPQKGGCLSRKAWNR